MGGSPDIILYFSFFYFQLFYPFVFLSVMNVMQNSIVLQNIIYWMLVPIFLSIECSVGNLLVFHFNC